MCSLAPVRGASFAIVALASCHGSRPEARVDTVSTSSAVPAEDAAGVADASASAPAINVKTTELLRARQGRFRVAPLSGDGDGAFVVDLEVEQLERPDGGYTYDERWVVVDRAGSHPIPEPALSKSSIYRVHRLVAAGSATGRLWCLLDLHRRYDSLDTHTPARRTALLELVDGAWRAVPVHGEARLLGLGKGRALLTTVGAPDARLVVVAGDEKAAPRLAWKGPEEEVAAVAMDTRTTGEGVIVGNGPQGAWGRFWDANGTLGTPIPEPKLPRCLRPGADMEAEDGVVVMVTPTEAFYAGSCAGRAEVFVSRITPEGWSVIHFPGRGGMTGFAAETDGRLWLATTDRAVWTKPRGGNWQETEVHVPSGAELVLGTSPEHPQSILGSTEPMLLGSWPAIVVEGTDGKDGVVASLRRAD